jgi:5-methyltetrahydropteroyltriglutamate--homocysteine methyltransferase
MIAHNLGYPRVGNHRELKKACESFWAGKITADALRTAGQQIRRHNWQLQKEVGLQLTPSNDFSYYDQVLDTSLMVGAIPARYHQLLDGRPSEELTLYFAMARGYQHKAIDVPAMEMTKWFDTNYHYLVPEFTRHQSFLRYSDKAILEFEEARQMGIVTKPVLLGPVSYLLSGKEKEEGFQRIDLLDKLLPVYINVMAELHRRGAEWIQLDEPFLVMDLSETEKQAFRKAYAEIRKQLPTLKILVATYFGGLRDNTELAVQLPVCALHLDLVRDAAQLEDVLTRIPENLTLSLGVVDGRNIWKNDFAQSLGLIHKAEARLGQARLMIAPSCSLLHCPCDLELEGKLDPVVKNWMAFARQKLDEVVLLALLSQPETFTDGSGHLRSNQEAIESRRTSALIHKPAVKASVGQITDAFAKRNLPFAQRQQLQRNALQLPLFPTTTIGSFPQTEDIRLLRAKLKKGELSVIDYEAQLKVEILKSVRWQEKIGLDVLVHGEFERNDMVEYFGELLDGYVFTQYGWVQSYGSRCVKPPIIFGDIERNKAMTVRWSSYAQSLTRQPMKGMLTGPITMLQWSFVRDDQPRETTALQLALAIRDEVVDLETAGIQVIQIDEPAIREGLPLRRSDWETYLAWAVKAFKVAAAGVKDQTQIHTHMCYSEFNDIIQAIADLDADVITIETSRSQMELLDAFVEFKYPNEIGPGVYDIHSPRVPSVDEIRSLLEKALAVLPAQNIWVNPDCGLKTRRWKETEEALQNMVAAAQALRVAETETA